MNAAHCSPRATKHTPSRMARTHRRSMSIPRLVRVASRIPKLLDLRLGAPFAEAFRVERQLALAVEQLVGDLAHPRGVFEDHAVWAFEIEEPGRGCRMPSRTEHHAHP